IRRPPVIPTNGGSVFLEGWVNHRHDIHYVPPHTPLPELAPAAPAKGAPSRRGRGHFFPPHNFLITLHEIRARLPVSSKQVWKLMDDGELRYINVGRGSKYRTMRVAPVDIDACIERLAKRNSRQEPAAPVTKGGRYLRGSDSAEVIGFTQRRLLK